MCRGRIDPTETDAERPRLCAECERLNAAKRAQTADLTGRVAVVTGGRVKIGFATARKLLRLGCEVAITTRFPRDAVRRFAAQPDSAQWLSRLTAYGCDFRHAPSVEALGAALCMQRINSLHHKFRFLKFYT